MMKRIHLISSMIVCIFISCDKGTVLYGEGEKNVSATDVTVASRPEDGKERSLMRFSKILSKAVYENQKIREFLKEQALRKIDNGYNVFYPVAKDEKIDGRSFKEVLSGYAANGADLDSIENQVPLLNIHLPEIGRSVSDWDVTDEEMPVLYRNALYLDGEAVDSLAEDEVPGFSVFVVSESNSIRKKGLVALGMPDGASPLNGRYEYVDQVFDPGSGKGVAVPLSSVEYDSPDDKYDEQGIVPKDDVDPLVIAAYNHAKNNLRATRYFIYYNTADLEEEPSAMRTDVRDCLFRFKIAADAFSTFNDVADGVDEKRKPVFNGSQSHKKSPFTREEALSRLMTGRAYCFLFTVEGSIDGNKVLAESIKIYATPEKIFNLKINESKRHRTLFRHTKYTYTIDAGGVKTKWFYPMENGCDTRFGKWDIAAQEPVQKRIAIYLINPDEGPTVHITDLYQSVYLSGLEAGGNIGGSLFKELVNLGVNGKLDGSNTTTQILTAEYSVTETNQRIGTFQYHYFDDYPVQSVEDDRYVWPARKENGAIETSILPVSNEFFNLKRFRK